MANIVKTYTMVNGQPADATQVNKNFDDLLAGINADVSATDKVLGRATAGAGPVEEIPCTAAGRALIDDANAAAQIATLGAVGTGDARLSDARTPVAHNQLKATITDFPASMPASDVSAWAKAASKPSYTAAEVGSRTIATGTVGTSGTVIHGLGGFTFISMTLIGGTNPTYS